MTAYSWTDVRAGAGGPLAANATRRVILLAGATTRNHAASRPARSMRSCAPTPQARAAKRNQAIRCLSFRKNEKVHRAF